MAEQDAVNEIFITAHTKERGREEREALIRPLHKKLHGLARGCGSGTSRRNLGSYSGVGTSVLRHAASPLQAILMNLVL